MSVVRALANRDSRLGGGFRCGSLQGCEEAALRLPVALSLRLDFR